MLGIRLANRNCESLEMQRVFKSMLLAGCAAASMLTGCGQITDRAVDSLELDKGAFGTVGESSSKTPPIGDISSAEDSRDLSDTAKCISGLANLIPDEAARREACECTSDALQEEKAYSGARNDAYWSGVNDKVRNCGTSAGLSKADPFGILDDNDAARPGSAALAKATAGGPSGETASDDYSVSSEDGW
jgi:hypothetical protein